MRVRDGGVQAGTAVAMGRMSVAGAGRSRVGAWFALVAALALPVVASSEAAAQSAGASAQSGKTAGQFFEEGTKAADAGRWEEARTAFTEAWKLKQHWQIAAHLGRAELMAGRYPDAAEHLSYFLREAKGVSEDDRKHTQEMLDQALTKVGAVTVSVNVEGAEVLVDGRVVGKAPIERPVFVEPGKRVFEARREGYATARVTEEVRAGGTPLMKLSMMKDEIARQGNLRVGAGDRKASGTAEGEARGPNRAAIILGFGVSGALVIVGSVFAHESQNKSAEIELAKTKIRTEFLSTKDSEKKAFRARESEGLSDLEYERRVLAGVSFWGFLGAGVIGGATLTYMMLTPSGNTRTSKLSEVDVRIWGSGVSVVGKW